MSRNSERVSCFQRVRSSGSTIGMLILAVTVMAGCQSSRCSKCCHKHRHAKAYEETANFDATEQTGLEKLVASLGDQKSGTSDAQFDAFFVGDVEIVETDAPAAAREPAPVPALEEVKELEVVKVVKKVPAEIMWTKRGSSAAPARLNIQGREVRTVSGATVPSNDNVPFATSSSRTSADNDVRLSEPQPAPAVEFVSPPKKLKLEGNKDQVNLSRHDDYLIADFVFPDDVNRSREPQPAKTRQIKLTSFEEPADDGWRTPHIRR